MKTVKDAQLLVTMTGIA